MDDAAHAAMYGHLGDAGGGAAAGVAGGRGAGGGRGVGRAGRSWNKLTGLYTNEIDAFFRTEIVTDPRAAIPVVVLTGHTCVPVPISNATALQRHNSLPSSNATALQRHNSETQRYSATTASPALQHHNSL